MSLFPTSHLSAWLTIFASLLTHYLCAPVLENNSHQHLRFCWVATFLLASLLFTPHPLWVTHYVPGTSNTKGTQKCMAALGSLVYERRLTGKATSRIQVHPANKMWTIRAIKPVNLEMLSEGAGHPVTPQRKNQDVLGKKDSSLR